MKKQKAKKSLILFFFLCGFFFTLSQLNEFKKVFGYGYGYSGKLTTVNSYKPAFSPDGNYIVYANTEDDGLLYKKNLSTGVSEAINSVNSYEPVYSPNGAYIVYSNFDDGGKLYRKSATDTGNGTAITTAYGRYPIYSPSGNYIVYVNYDDNRKLYRKSAGDATNGTAINSVVSSKAAYSPDGDYLVYPNMEDHGNIYKKVASDTGNGLAITTFSGLYPTYSPDGDYIVYSNVDDSRRLYRKNAAGSGNGSSITQTGKCDSPSYSPDGNYIVYERGGRIYKKDLSVKDIGDFSLEGSFNNGETFIQGSVNKSAATAEVTVPYGTDVTNLKPIIPHFGYSISPASGVNQNFTNPIAYTITALNGTTKTYTLTVKVDTNRSLKAITGFSFSSPFVVGTINETAKTISLVVPYGTGLTSIAPTIIHNGASVNPASGVAQNFTDPVTYRVTAHDGTTQDYTVTVTVQSSITNPSVSETTLKNDYQSGYISIVGSNIAATSKITFNVEYSLKLGATTVTIPVGTQMTATNGGSLDLGKISLSDIKVDVRADMKSGNLAGAIKFGIPNLKVTFSKPITITMPVGTAFNGRVLEVFYQNDKGKDWHKETTCTVSGGNCIFQVTHATKFSAIEGTLKKYKNYKGSAEDLRKYKFYKRAYSNKISKKHYKNLRKIKKSSGNEFQNLKNIFLAHKKEDKKIIEKLDNRTKDLFYQYKNYNGYKNYKHYKKIVGR